MESKKTEASSAEQSASAAVLTGQVHSRKSLLYMYVEDYLGFRQEGFNFVMSPRFRMDITEDRRSLRRAAPLTDREDYWENHPFFGENITGLSLLIGANGSGKTTIFRLLLSWLRDLSKGKLPTVPGVLVFREYLEDGNRKRHKDSFISFLNGKTIEPQNISIQESSAEEIRAFLQDVSFTYYTDTMTDIELSGRSFGWEQGEAVQDDDDQYHDYSLIQRLCRIPIDIKWNQLPRAALRKSDFTFQAITLLQKPFDKKKPRDIPVEYLRFTVNTSWKSTSLHNLVQTPQNEIIPESPIIDEPYVTDYSDLSAAAESCFHAWRMRLESLPSQQAVELAAIGGGLWCFIAEALGIVGLKNAELLRTLAAGLFRIQMALLQTERAESVAAFDDGRFTDIVKDYILNISDAFGGYYNLLRNIADQTCHLIQSTTWITKVSWKKQEEIISRDKALIWTTSVQEIRSAISTNTTESIIDLIGSYEKLPLITDYYRMDWHFPSSGEDNSCNLLAILTVLEHSRQNRWIFLDEPDNAFHPAWKQTLIQQIITYCRNQENASFQLWLTSHSPIMLSDVPSQAAVLLQREYTDGLPRKKCISISKSSFAQQIYTLFDDAFFMNQGVVGLFAKNQIADVCEKMRAIEKSNAKYRNKIQALLDEIAPVIEEVQEPVLKNYLSGRFEWCSNKVDQLPERVQKRKEASE